VKREIWEHARILTMRTAGSYGCIEDGTLVTEGSVIAWIGSSDTLPAAMREGVERTHDCGKRCITPGLIDAHTHLVYAGNRAHEFELRSAGASYADIARGGGGILSTLRATRAASEKSLYRDARHRLENLLNEGVTGVEIKSGYGLDIATELRQLRVARELGRRNPVTVRTTYLGLHTPPPEFPNADAYVDFVIADVLPEVAAEGLADAVDAFCENIAFSPAQIERFFTAAAKRGMRVKLHADQLASGGGAALAARFHALSADHLEYAQRADLEKIAAAGTVAVLLPGAYYCLREKNPPPVAVLRELGIPIALATDCNPGTSPITSLLLMLNMGCTLFGLTPEEVLAGVTRNAARALGIETTSGTLEPGKRADFAVWDIEDPRELAYAIGANPCAQVVQNGILVKNILA
jgi:imidazolonepropionase